MHLLLKPHRLMKIDSLEVNGRHYLLNVGIGLSAAIIQSTQRHQKRRFGFLAYVWNFLGQASGLRQRSFRLGIDGRDTKVRATELMVINSSIIGFGELPTVLRSPRRRQGRNHRFAGSHDLSIGVDRCQHPGGSPARHPGLSPSPRTKKFQFALAAGWLFRRTVKSSAIPRSISPYTTPS